MSFKVLMYHEVRDDGRVGCAIDVASGYQDTLPAPLYVDATSFKKQMLFLKHKNFYFMSLADVVGFYKGTLSLPKRAILLTFDDGFQSQHDIVYPILKALKIPAVMFSVGGWLFNDKRVHALERSGTMCVDEHRAIRDVFEMAHHTYNLHDRQHFLQADAAALKTDLILNRPFIDRCDIFAYPFGLVDDAMVEKLSELGITMAFTTQAGVNTLQTHPMHLHRYLVANSLDLEQFAQLVL